MSARDLDIDAADAAATRDARPRGLDYRTVCRWHFYAGLFCIPFVLWLSLTGSIYLFKPQIEAWLDRPYDHLNFTGPRAAPSAEVRAALAAVPGSVLNAYELPPSPQAAARVLVGVGSQLMRVYVHPQTLEVLNTVDEDARPMRLIFRLHGELMLGDRGSMLVELAASWTILMLLSGLYLWWPRGSGVAGVLYPRLSRGGRAFLRDLHAVIGFWVAFFALFLLVSGLPWAKSWGGLLKDVRSLGTTTEIRQDWSTGRSSELAARRAQNAAPTGEGHHHYVPAADGGRPLDTVALDRIVPSVQALALAPPVLIAPPSRADTNWNVRSDAQNRPLRTNLVLDADSGAVVKRTDFDQRPWIDRAVGIGVAAHEGQLFGWANQLLGVFTAAGLITVSVSAIVMWWRRRPHGRLGAPHETARSPRAGMLLLAFIALMAILLPLFGLSLLVVLTAERLLLRRSVRIGRFLGLRAA
jgi:uncharacterized iron-regulated membrane protein